MSKETYRVFAKITTFCYIDVEADSQLEALQVGYKTDGGDFTTEEGQDDGIWDIYDAKKLSVEN